MGDDQSTSGEDDDAATPAQPSPQEFCLQLIYHIPTKGKRGPKGAKKEARGKDLHFSCTPTNYLGFLNALLKRYGESKYKISATQRFPFKFHYPGRAYVIFSLDFFCSCAHYKYRKSDALDIDCEKEYREMVQKLDNNQWKKVHVTFDMDDIKKRCLAIVSLTDDEYTSTNYPTGRKWF